MCWIEVSALVRQAQAGDSDAFGELVVRFEGAVYAAAFAHVRAEQEALELKQEVFIHAMKKLPQLRDPRCFAGWLRRITARLAINRLSRKRPVVASEPDYWDGVASPVAEPWESIVAAEERSAVWTALARLKPLDRATLEGFYLRNESLQELAVRFDAPIGTIKRRLHVARKRLKAALEGRTARRRLRAVHAG